MKTGEERSTVRAETRVLVTTGSASGDLKTRCEVTSIAQHKAHILKYLIARKAICPSLLV
jgi:hypothetical protein|tara:strand:- start:15072 stop:15251 length:180 start_codon:yes stop_codon:yes gene_type:complete